jgi:type IV pilus assembly protein PilC
MAKFSYLAQDNQNKEVRGVLEARDINEAKAKLRQSNLYIIQIQPETIFVITPGRYRVSNMDLSIFSHQFAAMVSSGIPLIRALKTLSEETNNRKFRNIIDKIRVDIENGASLSDALAKYPRAFSNFFTSLIKTGETAGVLPKVLNRLASYLEKEENLRRKVVSSFAYPTIVAIVALAAVTFLLIFVVPVFSSVYKSLKITLPGPTVTLLALSTFFINYWWLILSAVFLIFLALRILKQNKAFGLVVDRGKLKIPVFGLLNRKVAASRFVRTLSTLVGSGVTLSSSLTITKEVVGNRAVAQAVEHIQKDINQGKPLAESLKQEKYFPPITVQMLAAGEESGNLNVMLDKCADFLDEDIDTLIKNLVVKLEPSLTIALAILVGFIALAIYLPMFDLIRSIAR